MTRSILAWHFVGDTLRDGRPVPPDGEMLRHDGEIKLCHFGLHASQRIIDALEYAPGQTICRVRCGGEIAHDTDKFVCTERTILWRTDGDALLRSFARQCALDVAHLWVMPPIVRQYLDTGNEAIRAAARAAANAAASAAARAAARKAAWAAASAAARAAARDAARAAARDAARAAASAAAWDAARDAARAAQNTRLTCMVMAAHKEARR